MAKATHARYRGGTPLTRGELKRDLVLEMIVCAFCAVCVCVCVCVSVCLSVSSWYFDGRPLKAVYLLVI